MYNFLFMRVYKKLPSEVHQSHCDRNRIPDSSRETSYSGSQGI